MMGKKRAVVFAGYSPNGLIFNDVFAYWRELRKYADYIIAVFDNDGLPKSELDKLPNYVDACILSRHGEYDFGSYKRGFFFLKEKGILDKVDKLILCNDSVIFQGRTLEPFFKREEMKDFYGFTSYSRGVLPDTFQWVNLPHIQSYFLSISKEIYSQDWFSDFMKSVEKQDEKFNVIAKYEIGISKLIEKHGYELTSFYPRLDTEPCRVFLSRFRGFNTEQEELFLLEKRQYAIAYMNGIMM